MAFLLSPLVKYVGGFLLIALVLGGGYAYVTTGAYNRGFAERDTQARKQLAELERRVAERLRKNEGLSDPEIDCALKKLRNPGAVC